MHSAISTCALTLGLLTSVAVAEDESAETAVRPLVSFVGANTRITKHQRFRFTNEEAWVQFWLNHEGKHGSPEDYNRYRRSGAPRIDFDQCMVIAITESPGELNAGIAAVSITETDSEIMFNYDNMFYQARAGTSAPGNAYGYFVLPRSTKPIVLRRNMQDARSRYTGGPPVWNEVERFEALETDVAESRPAEPPRWNLVFAHDPGNGNYDGVVGRPDDTWNFVPVGKTLIENLHSHDGAETNVTLTMSDNDGAWGIKEHSGVFHGYIYHNCQCVDLKVSLTGLPHGRYHAYVYAHGDAPNQNADIEVVSAGEKYGVKSTLNDRSLRFQSPDFAEGVHYVKMVFDVFNDGPVEITSRRSGSGYSMFNAIQIVPVIEDRE